MIKIIIHSKPDQRRGAALVEMALVMPLCLMIMLAIIESGRAMTVKQTLATAASTGARLASVDGSSNSDVEQSIVTFLQASLGMSAANITVTTTVTPGNGGSGTILDVGLASRGDLCTVVVKIPFDSVSYVPGQYLKGQILTGENSIQHE